ncbi:AAA family ATPase [Mesorhizobium sp. M0871]|uniref:AAA family ATPase n=1 Tax=Mesorhizobium sp. M0871 TaxID=2957017 RepID=UPI0033365930
MTTHLSARIAWHDTGWNGSICRKPSCNTSCIVHEHIRDSRDDTTEDSNAGEPFANLKGYLPPCNYEAATYASTGYSIEHRDPVEGRGLPSTSDIVPPFSTFTTPYRWMREENFADICQAEGLIIRSSPKGKTFGWVTEDDRQRALLKAFWEKIERRRSLVFYYTKDGNPFDESVSRLIVGVGRITDIGPLNHFGKHPTLKGQFPVWARSITQGWPYEGVRIPYQEYIDLGLDPAQIACSPPANQQFRFSYVAEHLTDGIAAMTLDRVLRSVEKVKRDEQLQGYDYDGALNWLNRALSEVWAGRGAYPGIGSLLRALGCEQGIHFQYSVLAAMEAKGGNPWEYTRSILERIRDAPSGPYQQGLEAAGEKWRALKTRHALLNHLVRFELSEDQFLDLLSETDRILRGIVASSSQIIGNPYLLCEQDTGTDKSEAISIELIDQGIRPEGAARAFGDPWGMAQDDKRRVRAIAHSALTTAASEGHTFLPVASLLQRVRDWFPERRACRPDEEVFIGLEDFHGEVLEFDDISDVPIVALKALRARENEVARAFWNMTRKTYDDAPAIDWGAQLRAEFGAPSTARQTAALDEKKAALERLYRNRISVLTGGAGVGKTRALKVFVDALIKAEGMAPLLLLAPTGKARVRLAENTKRRAQTIHQVLSKQKLIGPGFSLLASTREPPQKATTIIVDEASMPSVDLLASLLKAVDLNAVKRFVLVGDPHQLPPIGPGRPFAELIEELREKCPQCIGDLFTCMRTVEVEGTQVVSPGLELASTYRDEASPGDDSIVSRLARGERIGDVEIAVWNTQEELRQLIKSKLSEHLGVGPNDFKSFNRSLGFDTEDWRSAENWQILSPTRGELFGTVDINRLIQREFRGGMQLYARDPNNRMPRPFGDEEIVRGDKIINIRNESAFCSPKEKGLSYIANGEIGMVSSAYNKGYGDKLCVAFSSQPETLYHLNREEARDRLELAYALTVHKAQGSDFGLVFLVLPQEARTLSRELLYTALTRFKERLVILAERDIAPLLRLRAADASDARRRCSRLFSPQIPQFVLPPDDPRTPIYASNLKHRTGEGVKVRSKSEVIVAYALEKLGLDPAYEQPLSARSGNLKDFRLPDFTIMFEGETWYWEHLGMLSTPKYVSDWKMKQEWYKQNGYWDRVITSEDGADGSIDANEIEKTARQRIFE